MVMTFPLCHPLTRVIIWIPLRFKGRACTKCYANDSHGGRGLMGGFGLQNVASMSTVLRSIFKFLVSNISWIGRIHGVGGC